jgi:hypothetical protein
LPELKVVRVKSSLIAAFVVTLVGFIGIVDAHETIPGSHLLDWLTLPLLYGGFALGIMKSDFAAWLAIGVGFAWWSQFEKSIFRFIR